MTTVTGDQVTRRRRQGFVEGIYSRGQDPLPAVVLLKKNKEQECIHMGTAKQQEQECIHMEQQNNKNIFTWNSKTTRTRMYSHGNSKRRRIRTRIYSHGTAKQQEQECIHMEQQNNKNIFTWNSKTRTRTRVYSHGTAKQQEYIHMEKQNNKNKSVFTWNSKTTRTRMYSHGTAIITIPWTDFYIGFYVLHQP